LLDNFPLWLFDKVKFIKHDVINKRFSESIINKETIGFKLITLNNDQSVVKTHNFFQYFFNIALTFYHKQVFF
jgi:hypothetical protein